MLDKLDNTLNMKSEFVQEIGNHWNHNVIS